MPALRPSLSLLGALLFGLAAPSVQAAESRPVTVVELFTSQGCSSCPPANDNLAKLAGRRDLLALSFGVTYWDQLGWKDTFASPQYTQRQWAYAKTLHHDNVFTPQVVVQGRADTVGQYLGEIETLVQHTPGPAGPSIALTGSAAQIGAGAAPRGGPADVFLVRYETGVIQVPVRRGENTGRTLPHAHVVRSLVRLGGWDGREVRFDLPAGDPKLGAAVIVQSAGTGPILTAAVAG